MKINTFDKDRNEGLVIDKKDQGSDNAKYELRLREHLHVTHYGRILITKVSSHGLQNMT